jgi:hypothetical protein
VHENAPLLVHLAVEIRLATNASIDFDWLGLRNESNDIDDMFELVPFTIIGHRNFIFELISATIFGHGGATLHHNTLDKPACAPHSAIQTIAPHATSITKQR